ncbi:MAG TPA: alcohol dehydrogenase catalytic domain-containing protein [Candidatus Scatomorpha stercoravium]|nr:alcohol dehydrogenase catalytic domain-containing protein [Candidatus Scatomorpha stercoravium]
MRAGYMPAIRQAEFRDDMPEPMIEKADDVKIKVVNCGICGSEVHAYHGLHPFRIPPIVSGHEVAGDVVEVGPGVTRFKVGDRVTVEPHYGCGHCWYCGHGLYNVCPDKKVLGAGGWSGGLGEYIVTPEQTVVKLPDTLSYEEGALIEPVANGMYAVRHSNITPETNIVVIGCGPIGIGDFLCARLWNPKSILMVDVSDFNLQKAREMGAELTCNSRRENLAGRVMELTDGVGADLVFLAFGDAPTVQQAFEITRRGGQIAQHALMEDGIAFPYRVHQQHELDFKAYNMYTFEDFELIARAIHEGKMDLSHFVTQRYPIEQFPEAIEMADKRPEPVLKVMMHF